MSDNMTTATAPTHMGNLRDEEAELPPEEAFTFEVPADTSVFLGTLDGL